MKQTLLFLHLVLAASIITVFSGTYANPSPVITQLLSGIETITFAFIVYLWMKFIYTLSVESGKALHTSSNVRGFLSTLTHFDQIIKNIKSIESRFKNSADVISRLTQNDFSKSNQIQGNDPISQALRKMSDDMQKVKQQEDEQKWINMGLAHFNEILRNKAEIREFSYQILHHLVKYVNANQGGIYLEKPDENGNRYLELMACYAYERRKFVDRKIYKGQGLLGQCMVEKSMVFITDVPKDYIRITSGLGQATPRNIVIAPLILKETFYGAIELALFTVLKPFQIEFIEKVCANIASEIASVDNIQRTQKLLDDSKKLTFDLQQHEEEMQQNVEELTATQEEMARKQTELSGVLNAIDSTMATAEFDTKGTLLQYNSIMDEIFDFRMDPLRPKDIGLILGTENEITLHQIIQGKIKSGDYSTRSCSGESRWISVTFTILQNQHGETEKILCLVQDITQKKEAEKEFERLSLVANNTDNAVIITNARGITEYVNKGFSKMTGYWPEEITGKKPGDMLQGVDTDKKTIERIREKINKRQPVYEEILNYNKKGHSYWVSLAINPVFKTDGTLERFISIQADITETKKSSLDFQYKLEAISRSNATIEFDSNGYILDANENFLNLTGYTLPEIKSRHHKMLMTPETDPEEYSRFWEKIRAGGYVSGEFSRKTKSGKTVWLRGVYNPIFDMNGQVNKIIKFAVDITEEKRLQVVAKRKQKELNSYLEGINNTIASAEFEPNGAFASANEIFMKVMGYQKEELQGKDLDFLMGNDPVVTMMWENLQLGKFFSGEFKMKNKKGKELWLSGTFNPIIIDGTLPQKIMMFAQFTTQEKEKLTELNNLVQAFKYTLPVIEFNEKFSCKAGNEKLLRLFNLTRMDLRTKSILDFVDPTWHSVWNNLQSEILTQEFSVVRLPMKLPSQTITYEVSISVARDIEGKVSRIILLLIKEIEERIPVLAAV